MHDLVGHFYYLGIYEFWIAMNVLYLMFMSLFSVSVVATDCASI